MKKQIIAGLAASLAMAAMPVVGVFAEDEEPIVNPAEGPAAVEDVITVTVDESCTFNRTVGNGSYTRSMAKNALATGMGSSTYTAICNNATGFVVNAVFEKLTGAGEAIEYSETTPEAGSGTWTAHTDFGTGSNMAGTWQEASSTYTGGVLMSTNGVTTDSGISATVTYTVSTHANQGKGSYSGKATYTLSQNS